MARLWLPRSGKYGEQQLLDVLGSQAHQRSLRNTHTQRLHSLRLSLAKGQECCTTEAGISFDETTCRNPTPSLHRVRITARCGETAPVNPPMAQTYLPNKSNGTVNTACVCAECFDVFWLEAFAVRVVPMPLEAALDGILSARSFAAMKPASGIGWCQMCAVFLIFGYKGD